MNYPGADGLKTGYIRASGYNVATSAVRNGRRIIAVVMGGRSAYARDIADDGAARPGLCARRHAAEDAGRQRDAAAAADARVRADRQDERQDRRIADLLVPATKPVALAALGTPAAAPEAVTVQVADAMVDPAPAANSTQEAATAQIASIEPTAAPATTKTKSSAAKGRWGIQVGAFNAYELGPERRQARQQASGQAGEERPGRRRRDAPRATPRSTAPAWSASPSRTPTAPAAS